MIRKLFCSFLLIPIVFIFGCIDAFEPPIVKSESNYLVVEGVLISNGKVSTIKLSRTASLADTSYIKPVLFANVVVIGENGTKQPLTPNEEGQYSAILDIQPSEDYYVSISTLEGKNYRSEMIRLNQTPIIDSLTWKKNDEGIEIYTNTHDVENDSRYYKWNFVETWEFNAAYKSTLEYVDKKIVPRRPENQIYTCWQSKPSSSIIVGSTVALGKDIIYQKSITKVPFGWKLSRKYSILVSQYTLSEEAYIYFENMKKNTESLGSFYDAQPTEIKGNVYSLDNPGEVVIGYLYASSVEQKRIFISNRELNYFYRHSSCPEDVLKLLQSSREIFSNGANIPITYNSDGILVYTTKFCGDCRSRGFNQKPPFWQ